MNRGERPRHLEDLDARVVTIPVGEDPSWSNRPRKPDMRNHPRVIQTCGTCGKVHAFTDDRGERQRCGFCCKRHEWRTK